MFTKEDILGAELVPEPVDVVINGKNGVVYVRGMSGAERDRWEQETLKQKLATKDDIADHIRASVVCKTACNEKGVRLFSDSDVKAVSQKPAALLDPLYAKAATLSGIRKEDAEELAKNLQSDQSESST